MGNYITWRQLAKFINLDMDEWLKDAPAKIFVSYDVGLGFYRLSLPSIDECCLNSDSELLGFSISLWDDELGDQKISDDEIAKMNLDNATRKQFYMKPYISFC